MIHKLTSLSLCLTTSIYSSLSIFLLPAFAQESLDSPLPKVTFSCAQPSKESKNLLTTWVWIPEKKGYINFITWQPNRFSSNKDLQSLCQDATEKFQKAYDQGQLKYLITGTVDGNNYVCGVAQKDEECNAQNQLFTIKPTDTPGEVLGELISDTKNPDRWLQGGGGPFRRSWSELVNDKKVQPVIGGTVIKKNNEKTRKPLLRPNKKKKR
jgi:Circadian oscillating protein COP23